MNYADIVQAVKSILIEPVPSVTVTYIDSALNTAQRELEDRRIFKATNGFVTKNTIADLSQTRLFALPSDWNGPRHPMRPFWVNDEQYKQEMNWGEVESPDELRQYPELDGTGSPKILVERSYDIDYLYLIPIPDTNNDTSDGSYDVHIPYWKRLDQLDGTHTTNWFSENAFNYLIWKTAADCFLFNQDYNNHLVWNQRALDEANRLVRKAKRERLSVAVLSMTTDADAPSTQGRL